MESITKERAQAILELFKLGKDETMVFEEDGYDYMHTIIVGNEFKRMEKEIYEKIGECKNESEFLKKIKSKLLDSKNVIDAVIKRNFADCDDYIDFKTLKNKYTCVVDS